MSCHVKNIFQNDEKWKRFHSEELITLFVWWMIDLPYTTLWKHIPHSWYGSFLSLSLISEGEKIVFFFYRSSSAVVGVVFDFWICRFRHFGHFDHFTHSRPTNNHIQNSKSVLLFYRLLLDFRLPCLRIKLHGILFDHRHENHQCKINLFSENIVDRPPFHHTNNSPQITQIIEQTNVGQMYALHLIRLSVHIQLNCLCALANSEKSKQNNVRWMWPAKCCCYRCQRACGHFGKFTATIFSVSFFFSFFSFASQCSPTTTAVLSSNVCCYCCCSAHAQLGSVVVLCGSPVGIIAQRQRQTEIQWMKFFGSVQWRV